jgi:pilus assembly protein Flp/PilA
MRTVRSLASPIRRLLGDSRAATAIEYGLIVALIVLAMMIALGGLASVTNGIWTNVSGKVRALG